MNKRYFDSVKNLEVLDASGEKTIEQINQEFNGTFTDVTQERNDKDIENTAIAEERVAREMEDKERNRESAINKLVASGLLTKEEAEAF